MKTIKYVIIGLLLAGFSTSAMAQDLKTDAANISKVLKANKGNTAAAADAVKVFYKKYKKNAEGLTALGRAYLDAGDTENAMKYAQEAMKRNSQYGPANILAGDIEVVKDNGGGAAGWYQSATMIDPKNPEGYRKYAQVVSKVDPRGAVSTLEKLRSERPDIAVDAIAGRIYYNANHNDQAIEYYSKVDPTRLEDTDLTNFAMATWLSGKKDKSLEIAKVGLQKNPRKAAWNRLAMYNSFDLNKNQDALKYANALFNASDSAKISGHDYTYYGHALLKDKQYEKALDMYNKSIDAYEQSGTATAKNMAANNLKAISDVYLQKDDYENAINYYNRYITSKETPTATDLNGLATIYQNQASSLTGEAQARVLRKADAVYKQIGDMYPSQADFSNFMRARVNVNLDTDHKLGLAKPFYEKLVSSLYTKADRDVADKARLIESLRYLAFFNYVHKDKANCLKYCDMLLSVDPDNESARQLKGALQ